MLKFTYQGMYTYLDT